MSLQTFPSTLVPGYSLIKMPQFRNLVIGYGGRVEQRISLSSGPQYRFKLRWPNLSNADAATLRKFFVARQGNLEAFYLQAFEEACGEIFWTPSTTWAAGDIVRPTVANGRSYRCTTGGAGGSSQPTWPTTISGTVADGSATWTENTYTVRFSEGIINLEYVNYLLWSAGEIELIEVAG